MIIAEVTNLSIERVNKYIRSRHTAIVNAVVDEQQAITMDLQTYVKTRKLSGRPGLRNITGNLRRAINRTVIHSRDSIVGFVGVGSNATKYAKVHEFGGEIKVPAVSGKLMVFEKNGATVFTRKHKAFTVQMPQRSFLRSSLAENKMSFVRRLREAVMRGASAQS